jgi:hypothetical protein
MITLTSNGARHCRAVPCRDEPGAFEIQLPGSWRSFRVPADQADFTVEVVNAFLVVQAGASYCEAQADVMRLLGGALR